MRKELVLILCFCFALPGCFSFGGKAVMDPSPGKARSFDALTDEDAVKMVVKLESARPQTEEDAVAKTITLGLYTEELEKRNSSYVAGSGILRVPHPREDLKKWSLKDLEMIHGVLNSEMMIYKGVRLSDLNEEEKALRVIRMAASDAISRERRRRDLSRGMIEIPFSTVLFMVKFVLPI